MNLFSEGRSPLFCPRETPKVHLRDVHHSYPEYAIGEILIGLCLLAICDCDTYLCDENTEVKSFVQSVIAPSVCKSKFMFEVHSEKATMFSCYIAYSKWLCLCVHLNCLSA